MKAKGLWESIFTYISGCLYGFLISFAALAAFITAFSLQLPAVGNHFYRPVDLSTVLWYCILFSMLFSLFFTVKRAWVIVPIFVICYLGYHWHYGNLRDPFLDFLYIISKRYDNAYDCGVILIKGVRPIYADLMPVFRIFAMTGCAIVTWATCKRQSSYWVLLFSLLCFGPCCVMTNTVPDTWVLFLWIFVLLLYVVTNFTRKNSSKKSLTLALFYAAPVFVALFLLFTFIPREGYHRQAQAESLLSRFTDMLPSSDGLNASGGSGTKIDTSTDLTRLGNRRERRIPVLYLTAPRDGTYYLRGEVYSSYTGSQWIADPESPILPWSNDRQIMEGEELHIRTRLTHDMRYVPYCAAPAILTQGDMVLKNTEQATEYSYRVYEDRFKGMIAFRYTSLPYDADNLPYDADNFEYWTRIPESTKLWAKPFLDSLVQEKIRKFYESLGWRFGDDTYTVTNGSGSYNKEDVYHISPDFLTSIASSAISEYFQNSKAYNLQPDRMSSAYTDFAQWFVEEGESGYCVHFAATAAVLLRAYGIPARYVTGYVVDAQGLRETTVYQKDAHAWVEYWTEYKGWQILEVTPSRQESESTTASTEIVITTAPTEPSTSTAPTENTEATEPTTEAATVPNTPNIPGNNNKGSPAVVAFLWSILKWLLVPVCFVLIVIGQWKIRLLLRKMQYEKCTENEKTLYQWNLSLSYCRILKQKPDSRLKSLAEKAKFSPHRISTQELEAFKAKFDQYQQELKAGSFLRRICARWIFALY